MDKYDNSKNSLNNDKNSSSYSRILSIFKSGGGSDSVAIKSSRFKIGFHTASSYEKSIGSANSEDFRQMAGVDISALFMPFSAVESGALMPSFFPGSGVETSGFIGRDNLLPFYADQEDPNIYDRWSIPSGSGDSINYLLSGSGYYGDRYRDVSDVRSIGFRLPMIGVGWGYTTTGQAWPSGSDAQTFKGGWKDGSHVDPADYVAAPIDIRYDISRNVWSAVGKSGFWARITGWASGVTNPPSGFSAPSGTILYEWEESELGPSGEMYVLPNGRTGNRYVDPAFEVNDNPSIPSGTFVWMPDKIRTDSYSFEYGNERNVWLKIISYSVIPDRSNSWKYGFIEQALGRYGQFVDRPNGYSTANDGFFAYNSIEANNSASGYQGNSINVDTLPPTMVILPVRGNPVVKAQIMTNCDGENEFIFEYVNSVDGDCE